MDITTTKGEDMMIGEEIEDMEEEEKGGLAVEEEIEDLEEKETMEEVIEEKEVLDVEEVIEEKETLVEEIETMEEGIEVKEDLVEEIEEEGVLEVIEEVVDIGVDAKVFYLFSFCIFSLHCLVHHYG